MYVARFLLDTDDEQEINVTYNSKFRKKISTLTRFANL